MLSFLRNGYRPLGDNGKRDLSLLLTSPKLIVALFGSLCFFGAIFGFFSFGSLGRSSDVLTQYADANTNISLEVPGATGKGRFHFLIPATQSNLELCKLLVSAQILDYPAPVLINWGMQPGEHDDTNTHLAKMAGFVEYLDGLEKTSETFDEDLVLIVDGYDVWFQLRRDVMLKRYYELMASQNAKRIEEFGQEIFEQHDMRETIFFGHDKVCWPIDMARPACWAAPQANMSEFAFGPETNTGKMEYNHPRWLNSGTILGPAKDLRDLFNATLEVIDKHWEENSEKPYKNSDQFYMAEIFGMQAYARLEKKPELMRHYKNIRYDHDERAAAEDGVHRDKPKYPLEHTEYHVGIDMEGSLFQGLAFWKQYITWMQPSTSWPAMEHGVTPGYSTFQYQLQDDVAHSPGPFSALEAASKSTGVSDPDTERSWSDVELLYNTVTEKTPALLHMTAEKQFRHLWWEKLWFQAHAEKLRLAAIPLNAAADDAAFQDREVIGGFRWYNAEPPEAVDIRLHGRHGAWSDKASWLAWRGTCEDHEGVLYNTTMGPSYNHPTLNAVS